MRRTIYTKKAELVLASEGLFPQRKQCLTARTPKSQRNRVAREPARRRLITRFFPSFHVASMAGALRRGLVKLFNEIKGLVVPPR